MQSLLSKTCCLCVKGSELLQDITSSGGSSTITYKEKLSVFAPKQRWLNRFKICSDCIKKLDSSYDFSKTCFESDNLRKEKLKQEIIENAPAEFSKTIRDIFKLRPTTSGKRKRTNTLRNGNGKIKTSSKICKKKRANILHNGDLETKQKKSYTAVLAATEVNGNDIVIKKEVMDCSQANATVGQLPNVQNIQNENQLSKKNVENTHTKNQLSSENIQRTDHKEYNNQLLNKTIPNTPNQNETVGNTYNNNQPSIKNVSVYNIDQISNVHSTQNQKPVALQENSAQTVSSNLNQISENSTTKIMDQNILTKNVQDIPIQQFAAVKQNRPLENKGHAISNVHSTQNQKPVALQENSTQTVSSNLNQISENSTTKIMGQNIPTKNVQDIPIQQFAPVKQNRPLENASVPKENYGISASNVNYDNETPEWDCFICDLDFGGEEAMRSHVANVHYKNAMQDKDFELYENDNDGTRTYICNYCSHHYEVFWKLRGHVQYHKSKNHKRNVIWHRAN